jgi:hypothetical protein
MRLAERHDRLESGAARLIEPGTTIVLGPDPLYLQPMDANELEQERKHPKDSTQWLVFGGLAAAIALVICFVFIRKPVDRTPAIRTATTTFVESLSTSKWQQAADMGTGGSEFIEVGGRKYVPGGVPRFVKLITTAGTMQSMTVTPHKIIELTGDTYAVVGDVKMDVTTATGAAVSLQWGIQLVWTRSGDTWKLQQIKELTPRRPVRATVPPAQ